MRNYYNTNITCPNCLKPYSNEILEDANNLDIYEDGKYQCQYCKTIFNYKVELEQFKDISTPGSPKGDALFPLYRRVDFNAIEKDYINWIANSVNGLHLITWPWKDVRFFPVAITEFIEKNDKKKVLILSDSSIGSPANIIDIINNTFYIDNVESILQPSNFSRLKKDRDIKNNIYFKHNVINVTARKLGQKGDVNNYTCFESLTKCRNHLLKELFSDFGNGFLKKIEPPLKSDPNHYIDSENGKWDISFNEREEWSGKDLDYNILWMKEVLSAGTNVKYCRDIIKPTIISNGENNHKSIDDFNLIILNPNNDQLYDSDSIFSTIKSINPDLILIANTDYYVEKRWYRSNEYNSLLAFLESNTSPVIMFSTNRESRQYYDINKKDNNFLKLDVDIHTIDNDVVLKKYANLYPDKDLNPTPLSSGNLPLNNRKNLDIEYIECNSYLYDAFSEYLTNTKDVFINQFKFFLRNFISSPLNLYDENQKLQFVAKKSPNDPGISYQWIIDTAYDRIQDEKLPREFGDLLKRTLSSDTYYPNINPLRDKLIEIAFSVPKIENLTTYVFVIVSPFDVTGFSLYFKQLIDIEINNRKSSNIIKITTWKKLSKEINIIDKNSRIYVISTRYPSIEFKMDEHDIYRYYFVCDNFGIRRIKEIVEKRLLERNTSPFIFPSNHSLTPTKFQNILEGMKTETANECSKIEDKLDEYYQEEEETSYRYISRNQLTWHSSISNNDDFQTEVRATIPAESDAILCINSEHQGLFIPMDTNILTISSDFFKDIKIDASLKGNKLKESLLNANIVISKNSIYSSFRSIFMSYMMKHQGNIGFDKLTYHWNNFKELYLSATSWIQYIKTAIAYIVEKDELNEDDAQNRIIISLSNAGLTAKDPHTIYLWLKPLSTIEIDNNVYDVYRTEHPFKIDDLNIIKETLKDFVNNYDDFDIYKSYAAAILLQDIRNKVLKGGKSLEDKVIHKIYDGLDKERSQILLNAVTFKPIIVERVITTQPVEAMRVLNNFTGLY